MILMNVPRINYSERAHEAKEGRNGKVTGERLGTLHKEQIHSSLGVKLVWLPQHLQ